MTQTLKLVTCDKVPRAIDSRPIALVAEPDRLRGALIVAGLEDLGIEVICVAHGDLALESAEEQSFDVHVADPSLRSTQGERVVQALLIEHPRVPLVVTGASAAAVHLASARTPVATVVDLVRAALRRRREPAQRSQRGLAEARATPEPRRWLAR